MTLESLLVERRAVRFSTAKQYVGRLCFLFHLFTDFLRDNNHPYSICFASFSDWLWTWQFHDFVTDYLSQKNAAYRISYYSALVVVINTLLPDLQGSDWETAFEYLRIYERDMADATQERRREDTEQRLDRREKSRWRPLRALELNMNALRMRSEKQPNDPALHFRYLLYYFYVCMSSFCALRLDVVYTTKVFFGFENVPVDESSNYFVIARIPQGQSKLILQDFKTSRSHGRMEFVLPADFAMELGNSLLRFPRKWFIPSARNYDLPMTQGNASRFVKQCWVRDDGDDAPTADDIRSAVVTSFFDDHPYLVERDVFAARSMSSRDTMERCYYKRQ